MESEGHPRTEPPLWAMGLTVAIILVAPAILYSLAPTGPLREGDTIFSRGEQRVLLTTSAPHPGLPAEDSCLLDPDNPLIIIRRPADRPGSGILAEVQGRSAAEWPFCPPHAEVLLKEHQTYQKPDMLNGLRKISGFFSR